MFGWFFPKRKLKFRDVFTSKADRYSLGIEDTRETYYLSIPVSNRAVDYEEYYKIDRETFERFKSQPELAIEFAVKCRNREVDHLLLVKPGQDRGAPS